MTPSRSRCAHCGRAAKEAAAALSPIERHGPRLPDLLRVSDVEFVRPRGHQITSGLLGWVSFTLGAELRVDSVALRRSRDGQLFLAFPARRSRTGIRYPYVTLLSAAARREIERQMFAELRCQGGAP